MNNNRNNDRRITASINRQIDRRNRRLRGGRVPRGPSERVRARRRRVNYGMIIACVLIIAVIIVSIVAIILHRSEHNNDGADSTFYERESDVSSFDSENDDRYGFVKIEVDTSSLHQGFLILVNYENEYVFPSDERIVALYGNKSKYLKLSNSSVSVSADIHSIFNSLIDDLYDASGCNEVLLTSGYRDYASQKKLFDDRVATAGEEQARLYVSLPGYSEHHTGLALDLTVLAADGLSYSIATYPQTKWFVDNAEYYGFVLRYPQDKVDITKIGHEPWHYRYVGTPHAEIMNSLELCLEEYIEYLREFEYGKRYLIYSDGEIRSSSEPITEEGYMIYYVPAGDAATTEVYVPSELEYSISGNNIDGFIITTYSAKQ